MTIDLKVIAQSTVIPNGAVLFGANSLSASTPSNYPAARFVQYSEDGNLIGPDGTTTLFNTKVAQAVVAGMAALGLSLPTATWSNSGISYTGLGVNVTDTASAAGSKLLDLQVGGASKFNVSKTGALILTGGVSSLVSSGSSVLQLSYVGISDWEIRSGLGGTSNLSFYSNTNSAEQMRLNAAGNLGIGTTSPSYKLDVAGVVNATSSFRGPYWDIPVGATHTYQLGADGASGGFYVYDGSRGVYALTVKDSGYVGIGTTSPSLALSVITTNAQRMDGVALGTAKGTVFIANDDINYGLMIGSHSNGNTSMQVQRVDGGATAYHLNLNPLGGNVGIGTLSPASKLHVSGPVLATAFNVTGAVAATDGMWGAAGAALSWNIGSVEKMRLDTTGLGVGTNSPDAKFQVVAASAGLRIGFSGSNNYYDANLHHFRDSASGERVVIDAATGRIGIGQSTPLYALDIANGVIAVSNLDSSYTTRGTLGAYNDDANNGGLVVSALNAGSLVEVARVTGTKRIGVGVTGPAATIHAANTGGYSLGLSGATKGIRVAHDSSTSSIWGVDNTLVSSFQPLMLGGSTLTLAVPAGDALTIDAGQIVTLVKDYNVNGHQVGRGGGNIDTNLRVGYLALSANTTGAQNAAFGYLALASNTTANYNTAVGSQALRYNTTGYQNTAVGVSALGANTTGVYNVAVGVNALLSNTTGSNNIAVGNGASQSSTTGDYNSSLGYYALIYNTTGAQNTAIGAQALQNNITGNFNTGVGVNALMGNNASGSSNTAIGHGTMVSNTSGYENTVVGREALYSNTTGYQNVAIGRETLNLNTTGAANTGVGFRAFYAVTTGNHNTALGWQAGRSVTNGQYNTFIGSQSGYSVIGGENTAIGYTAMFANNGASTGTKNVGIGWASMYNITTGTQNVFVGHGTAYSITTATDNVGVGYNALNNLSTGSVNTAVGSFAMSATQNGTYNTAVGYGALNANIGGSNSTAVGYAALLKSTAGGNTAVGYSSLRENLTGVSLTAVGTGAMSSNTSGNDNTAFGASALNANTTAGGNTALGSGSLLSNTTGGANTGAGYLSLYLNTTGGVNAAFGAEALRYNSTGSYNVAVGSAALYASNQDYSVAVGYGALYTENTAGAQVAVGAYALQSHNSAIGGNTAVGYESGRSMTTGGYNVYVGGQTGRSTTTAQANTFVGFQAGYYNTTGSYNTALGYQSALHVTTGAYNTALGYSAQASITTGYSNVSIGYNSLISITTGQENTAIGTNAGNSITDGYYNVLIGNAAGAGLTGSNHGNTIIGYGLQGVAGQNNTLQIGNTAGIYIFGNSSKQIGIGTTTPGYWLDVVGDTSGAGVLRAGDTYNGGVRALVAGNYSTAVSAGKGALVGYQGVSTGGAFKEIGLIGYYPYSNGDWDGSRLVVYGRRSNALFQSLEVSEQNAIWIGNASAEPSAVGGGVQIYSWGGALKVIQSDGTRYDVSAGVGGGGATYTNAQFAQNTIAGFGDLGSSLPDVTWNNGATAFNGFGYNVTNTASSASSKLLDIQLGSVSKLKMDLLGNVGIGQNGSINYPNGANRTVLEVNGATEAVFALSRGGSSGDFIYSSSSGTEYSTASTRFMVFKTNSANRMRITSTGLVGIGIDAPSSLFHVYKASNAYSTLESGDNSDTSLTIKNTTAQTMIGADTVGSYVGAFTASKPLTFYSGGALSAQLSQGNFYLGSTDNGLFDAAGRVHLNINGTSSALLSVAYGGTAGSYIYTHAGGTSIVETRNLPMMLHTNNVESLMIGSDGSLRQTSSAAPFFLIRRNLQIPGENTLGIIFFQGRYDGSSYGDGAKIAAIGTGSAWTSTNTPAYLQFFTTPTGSATSVERMRINDAGSVLIGGDSTLFDAAGRTRLLVNGSGGALFGLGYGGVAGSYIYTYASGTEIAETRSLPLMFYTAGTERARFDASGRLGIGTASPNQKVDIVGGHLQVRTGYSVIADTYTNYGAALTVNSGASLPIYFKIDGNLKMGIISTGDVSIGGTPGNNYASANRTVLEVNGTSESLLAMSRGGTGGDYVYSNAGGLWIEAVGARMLSLYANSGERLRVGSEGGITVFQAGSTPAAPTTNANTLFSDSDGVLKVKNAAGTVMPLQTAISVQDEGSTIGGVNSYDTINFVGAGISAAIASRILTVTVAGGGTGGMTGVINVADSPYLVGPGRTASQNVTGLAAAMTAASTSKSAVYIPAFTGNADINDEITVPDGVYVYGAGWHSKIRQTVREKRVFVSGNNCRFENLHLIGDGSQTTVTGYTNCGIVGVGKVGIIVRDCWLEAFEDGGVNLLNCSKVEVVGNRIFGYTWNLTIAGAQAADIILQSSIDVRGALIADNWCLSNNSQGILLSTLSYDKEIICRNNVCVPLDPTTCTVNGTWSIIADGSLKRRHGIVVAYANSGSTRILVQGNLCANTGWSGIYNQTNSGGGPVEIVDNICIRNGVLNTSPDLSGGIVSNTYSDSEIVNNTILDFQRTELASAAINVIATGIRTQRTRVAGNKIHASLGNGIGLNNFANDVLIENNMILDCQGRGIVHNPTATDAGEGGFVIRENTIRMNAVLPAISLGTSISTKKHLILSNILTGTSPGSPSNNSVGILTQKHESARIRHNVITGFSYGIAVNSYATTSRLFDISWDYNELNSCTVGITADAANTNAVVPLEGNKYISCGTNIGSYPPVAGYVRGFDARRLGTMLEVVSTGSTVPTQGTWNAGDRVWYATPSAGSAPGAVCLVGGIPGSWENMAYGGLTSGGGGGGGGSYVPLAPKTVYLVDSGNGATNRTNFENAFTTVQYGGTIYVIPNASGIFPVTGTVNIPGLSYGWVVQSFGGPSGCVVQQQTNNTPIFKMASSTVHGWEFRGLWFSHVSQQLVGNSASCAIFFDHSDSTIFNGTFYNCWFDMLYRGIVLSNARPGSTIWGIRIEHCFMGSTMSGSFLRIPPNTPNGSPANVIRSTYLHCAGQGAESTIHTEEAEILMDCVEFNDGTYNAGVSQVYVYGGAHATLINSRSEYVTMQGNTKHWDFTATINVSVTNCQITGFHTNSAGTIACLIWAANGLSQLTIDGFYADFTSSGSITGYHSNRVVRADNCRFFNAVQHPRSVYGNVPFAPEIISGYGSPEGVITALQGTLYVNGLGGSGTTLYVKQSGTGNTGWSGLT